MNRDRWTIVCLSYIVGLFFTALLGYPNCNPTWLQWAIVTTAISSLSLILAIIIPKRWPSAPRGKFWLIAGLIALLATVYFQWRVPYPSKNDISKLLKGSASQTVIVEGKVVAESRLNTSQRLSFVLNVNTVSQLKSSSDSSPIVGKKKKVTGNLYVTVPSSQDKKYYPGQTLTIQGVLYKPKSASTPGAFDFKAYLARQATFAGLKGEKVTQEEQPPWGFWIIRQRIVKCQNRWLDNPVGPLVSSMVIGRQAVDIEEDLRVLFTQAGLAHILAASGFQIALLLGVVVFITRKLSGQQQLIIGLAILILYVGLTGIQPSVIRAALMGVGGLIGLISNRKINSLGALLLAGTIILLFNPLWIWDLGFQLSFLATFGLIVTMPWLQQKLDWLPPTIIPIIAVPIAASVWTLPLLMQAFSTVATYSIPLNIITAPLVTVISLGGMLSAGIGLFFPLGGSAIAWLLNYPTQFLINLIKFIVHLPASTYAVGKLSVGMMLLIYAVLLGIWLNSWCQKHWKIISLFLFTVVIVPIVITRLSLVQVTVLPTQPNLSIVIQNRGKVAVINGADSNAEKYSLVPFFTYQGVNQIDWAIAFDEQESTLNSYIPVKQILNQKQLSAKTKTHLGNIELDILNNNPTILQFMVANQKWLWLIKASKPPYDEVTKTVNVLLWSSKQLNTEWIDMIKPEIAIAVSPFVEAKTRRFLQHQGIKLYWTGKDGAIQWTPKRGFQTSLITEYQDIS